MSERIEQVDISVFVQKANGRAYEIASVEDVKVSMSKNSATTLSVKSYRDVITPEVDEGVLIMVNKSGFVWGYIDDTDKKQKFVTINASDQLRYLVSNIRTQNYGAITLSEFVRQVLADMNANRVEAIDDTSETLPEIIMQESKVLDTIVEQINKEYDTYGKKYFIYDNFNNLNFKSQLNMLVPMNDFVISHYNTFDYDYKESVKDQLTAVTVKSSSSSDGQAETFFARNESAITRHGFKHGVVTANEGENLSVVAAQTLENKGKIYPTLTCSTVGHLAVRPGCLVFVDYFTNGEGDQREFIHGWFEVDSVTHNFSLGTYTMDLDMSLYEMEPYW